jgi:hypothetical protein
VPLRACSVRRQIAWQAAPHDYVWLFILDRLPRPQNTLTNEAAALGNMLRGGVVEMRHELNPSNVMSIESPLSNQVQRLDCQASPSFPSVEPVERLCTPGRSVELDTDLPDAAIRRWKCDSEPGHSTGPPLGGSLDPLPRLLLGPPRASS